MGFLVSVELNKLNSTLFKQSPTNLIYDQDDSYGEGEKRP